MTGDAVLGATGADDDTGAPVVERSGGLSAAGSDEAETLSESQNSLKLTSSSPRRDIASRRSDVSDDTVVENSENRSIFVMLEPGVVRCTSKKNEILL